MFPKVLSGSKYMVRYEVIEMKPTRYKPMIENHPAYTETPEFEVGQVVEVLSYNGCRVIREETDGLNSYGDIKAEVKYMGNHVDVDEGIGEPHEYDFGAECKIRPVRTYRVVEKDGLRTKVKYTDTSDPKWIPTDMIVGIDEERTEEWKRKVERRKRREHRRQQRKDKDLDEVMEVIVNHAWSKAMEVWDEDEMPDRDWIEFFWNNHLQSYRGRAYYGSAIPKCADTRKSYAVGIRPSLYYEEGIDVCLKTMRHELIHIWQFYNGKDDGHGESYKQWADEMDVRKKPYARS